VSISTTVDLLGILEEMRARLARLEAAANRRKKRFNQKQAAEYLNRSEEWIRREHAAGRGPKRTKRGRYYDYTIEDLDAYADAGEQD
jgi:hypothetical protein